jgi:hypothetical protein
MNGDHANNEKGTATAIGDEKREQVIFDLGMKAMSEEELYQWVQARQIVMVQEIGVEAWDNMPAKERARQEEALVRKIILELGKDEFDKLSEAEKQQLTLFIWCGCCMHKDMNTFKAGCMQLAEVWEELNLPGPCLLANKANAQILRDLIEPGADTTQPMTEEQIMAFESTSRGGLKFLQIAAAIFANKDDKKGQGDRLIAHQTQWKRDEREKHKKKRIPQFPDICKTRFGSYGRGASHVLKHLDFYRDLMEKIQWTKDTPGLTNIEPLRLMSIGLSATLQPSLNLQQWLCIIRWSATHICCWLELQKTRTQTHSISDRSIGMS